jgi:hypothetical protein
MASRYERSVAYQPTGANFARANTAGKLADALSEFSGRAGEMGAQLQSARGTAAGAQSEGVPQPKSSVTAYGRAFNNAATAAYKARAQIDIEDTYARLERENPTDPMAYEAKSEGYRKGLLKLQRDPVLRTEMDILSASRASEGRRRVADQALAVEQDSQRTDILSGLDSMVQAAARKVPMEGPLADEAMAVLQTNINESLLAGQEAGLFSASQVRQLRDKYAETAQRGFQSGQVNTLASSIMGKYQADVRAGDRALAELDGLELDDGTKIEVQEEVRKRFGLMQDERKRQYVEASSALHRDIEDGDPSPDAEGAAIALYRKGVYSPAEYTSILGRIDTARAKHAEDEATITNIENAFVNGVRLDPKNEKVVKAVDKWFAKVATANNLAPGSDEWTSYAAQIASRTNILPPQAMSWARSSLLSGEPELASSAANAMTRWSDAAPTAYSYFDDPNMKAYADQVSSMVQAGALPETAVEVARANTFDIPEQRKKSLGSAYTKEKYAESNAGDLKSKMDGDDAFDRALLAGSPTPPLGMRDEYERSVRAYYDRTNGDINKARELAWKDIRGVYGYSEVNGEPEVMKYAPELIFPGIDVKVIQADLAESAKAAGIQTPVRLTPAPATGDTNGVLWQLTTTDEDGFEEVVLDEKNRPRVYAIPTQTDEYVRAQEDAKKKAVADARAESAKRRKIAEEMAELGSFPGY